MYEKLIENSVNEFKNEGNGFSNETQSDTVPKEKVNVSTPPKGTQSKVSLFPLVFLNVLLALFSLYFYFENQTLQKELAVTNFEECKTLKANIIQESDPSVCVTKNGLRFTASLPEVIETVSSPTPTPVIVPGDWITFENTSVGYSLRYPPDWEEPQVSTVSGRMRLRLNNIFTIENGGFTELDSGRKLTFNEFVEENRPPAKTVTNFTLNGVSGKQFTFQKSARLTEYLIAIPLFNTKTEIMTISYNISSDNPDLERIYFQLVNSFEFTSDGITYLDEVKKQDINRIASILNNYIRTRKTFPLSLEDLIPTYAKTIPENPVTGESYTYSTNTERTIYTLTVTLSDGSSYEVKSE